MLLPALSLLWWCCFPFSSFRVVLLGLLLLVVVLCLPFPLLGGAAFPYSFFIVLLIIVNVIMKMIIIVTFSFLRIVICSSLFLFCFLFEKMLFFSFLIFFCGSCPSPYEFLSLFIEPCCSPHDQRQLQIRKSKLSQPLPNTLRQSLDQIHNKNKTSNSKQNTRHRPGLGGDGTRQKFDNRGIYRTFTFVTTMLRCDTI